MSTAPDGDPGWRLSPRLLLALLPGFVRFAAERRLAPTGDGLAVLRQAWLGFVVSMVLFGVVIVLVDPAPSTQPVAPWLAGLGFVSAVCLGFSEVIGRRPLDCTDARTLVGSYRARLLLRVALSETGALLGFVVTFIVGRWWVYWLFLLLALVGLVRAMPGVRQLRIEQERLALAGRPLSLVAALRGTGAAGARWRRIG